jgi:hypothetical protein
MSFPTKRFTVIDGLKMQENHLKEWKSVLSTEAYEKLEKLAKANNHTATSGYDIARGTDLDMIVHNQLMKHTWN